MAVTRPPALNESFNTTGQNPENIADALKSGLAEIVSAIGGDTEVDSVKEVRLANGDANSVLALNTVNFTEIFHGTNTPAADNSESYLYLTGLGGDPDNGGVQIAIGAYPSANDKIFYRRFNGGSWGEWKQIYGGIRAGTPTNIIAYVTLDGTYSTVYKSGNVVSYKLRFTVNTAFTPTESTLLCKMPWSNIVPWGEQFRTMEHSGSDLQLGYAFVDGVNLYYGTAPYTALAVGDKIRVSGTYITND